MCVNLIQKFVNEGIMKRLLVLSMAALILSGCASRGPFSGAVDGDKMLNVEVTEGKIGGVLNPFSVNGNIDKVVVEETTVPIIGVSVEISTNKVNVRVSK